MSGMCPISNGGHPLVHWASFIFSECVYSNRQAVSLILGNVSLLFWMVAQFPQLWKNIQRGSVESLSPVFLTAWLLGDATNLLGCILTHQQPFQTRMAAYFVSMDIVLLGQYIYFYWKYHQSHEDTSEEVEPLLKNTRLSSSALVLIMASEAISPVSGLVMMSKLTSAPISHDSSYEIGLFFSWICTALYLSSRIPQILLNHSRRSVSGVSIPMFFCAFMGNMTYSLSLVMSDAAVYGGHEFWVGSLPFLLGSAGTLLFDGLIFTQSLIYKD